MKLVGVKPKNTLQSCQRFNSSTSWVNWGKLKELKVWS